MDGCGPALQSELQTAKQARREEPPRAEGRDRRGAAGARDPGGRLRGPGVKEWEALPQERSRHGPRERTWRRRESGEWGGASAGEQSLWTPLPM